MPLVPKRHASHHQHRQFVRDFAQTRDFALSIEDDASLQSHSTLVLSGAALFVLFIVAYSLRRHIRSVPSRLAHAISVHGTASHLIHIHLHTAHYSPLYDDDSRTVHSDIEARVVHEEPAPPYSAPTPPKERTGRPAKALQITVPPRSIGTSQHNGASVSSPRSSLELTPSLLSDAGSSRAASSPIPSLSTPISIQQNLIELESLSKPGGLDLASPRASRWDAFPRYTTTSTKPKISGNTDIMTTGSPCATPPPQYTITIHSSPRSRHSEADRRPTPDIVLSPVPWLPREYVPPPSPPHYLSVPARKSKSRQPTVPKIITTEKVLPPTPQRQSTPILSKSVPDVVIKQRHAPLDELLSRPTTSIKPALPLGFGVRPPRRSVTLPNPPPPPKPVIPLDLEAVYPTSPTKANGDSDGQSEEDTPWLWRSRTPLPSKDRHEHFTGDVKSGIEKSQYREKDSSSDSDDVPLARGLVLAVRRRKEKFGRPTSPVSQVFKKQVLGRLSALAARARSAIEHEFDSSDDEVEEERVEIQEKAILARRNFVEREARAVDTFIIGDEE